MLSIFRQIRDFHPHWTYFTILRMGSFADKGYGGHLDNPPSPLPWPPDRRHYLHSWLGLGGGLGMPTLGNDWRLSRWGGSLSCWWSVSNYSHHPVLVGSTWGGRGGRELETTSFAGIWQSNNKQGGLPYKKYQNLVHNRCAKCNLYNLYNTFTILLQYLYLKIS